MIEQCDILFAYYYDDIPDSINTDINANDHIYHA